LSRREIGIDIAIGYTETSSVAVIPCCDRALFAKVISPIIELSIDTF